MERILAVRRLMKQRDEARDSGNYARSDFLREKLVNSYGVDIVDQKGGPSGWKFKDGSAKKLPPGLPIPEELKETAPEKGSHTTKKETDEQGTASDRKKNKKKQSGNMTKGKEGGTETAASASGPKRKHDDGDETNKGSGKKAKQERSGISNEVSRSASILNKITGMYCSVPATYLSHLLLDNDYINT